MTKRHTLAKLMERDGGKCRYCGRQVAINPNGANSCDDATRDHLIPKRRGGTDAQANIVLACYACNKAKADGPAPRNPGVTDWLDSWTGVRRAPEAKPHPVDTPPQIMPLADTMFILKHGKKAWRAQQGGDVSYTPEGWPIVPRCRKPRGPTAKTPDFDSGNGGSNPPEAASG